MSTTFLDGGYLVFEDWSQIAMELNWSVQHTLRLHNEALREFEKVLKLESK